MSPCIKKIKLNILKYLINKFTQDPIHLKSSLHRIYIKLMVTNCMQKLNEKAIHLGWSAIT
jgi:hypothetical protein